MSKPIFTPEDFKPVHEYRKYQIEAADIANAELEKLIESWPVVYCNYSHGKAYFLSYEKADNHTHRARLAFIEERPKEPCKHEPAIFMDNPLTVLCKCKHCGVELVAKWEAVK